MAGKRQSSLHAFAKKRTATEAGANKEDEPKKRGRTPTKASKKSKKQVESEEEEEKKIESPVALPDGDPFDSYENFEAGLGDWREPLSAYLKTGGLKKIFTYVKDRYSKDVCFPPREMIFNCFQKCKWENLKVVLMGQDPYIKDGEAMGLCFSIPKTVKCPPSLKNIYKSLNQDPKVTYKTPNPIHGDISNWADQGVLMINALLTVKKGVSMSHKDAGWPAFTQAVMQAINSKKTGIIFLLWGKKAEDVVKKVDWKKHHKLTYGHPSPLGQAHFENCRHFSETNEKLELMGKDTIDWQN